MNKYNFDEIVDRRKTYSAKWDVKENELPMWVADMDFHVLPEIKAAIDKRNSIDAFGYIECPKEYFESYSRWWNKHHNVDISTSDMTFCTGVVAAIDSIFKHLLPKGSGVVIMTPVYHVFFNCIKNNNLQLLDNELLYQDNEYSIDFDKLESQLESASCLLLCNPHNPIGRIWNEDELKRIVELCKKHNVLLVSDEIHCDIVEPGNQYNSILKYSNDAIALLSVTKSFNVAGIQTSVIVCKNHETLSKIQEGVGHDDVGEPNYFSPFAAIAALDNGEEWLKEMNQYVFNNKKYVMDLIKRELPEVKLVDNKATYLLWLNISSYGLSSKDFADGLRKETGLFVSPGSQFGRGGEGFLRINIATSLDNVKDACERLIKYTKTLQK